ncbi:TPA: transposase, partial [Vibrio diabolicus]
MKYTHLTENERYMISALRKQGINTAKIAKQLGRHKATIYREIERNSRYNRHFKRYSYQAWRAQQMARNRLSRSRRNKRYSEIDFRLPEALLRLDWSPDQIVGYLKVRGYPTM